MNTSRSICHDRPSLGTARSANAASAGDLAVILRAYRDQSPRPGEAESLVTSWLPRVRPLESSNRGWPAAPATAVEKQPGTIIPAFSPPQSDTPHSSSARRYAKAIPYPPRLPVDSWHRTNSASAYQAEHADLSGQWHVVAPPGETRQTAAKPADPPYTSAVRPSSFSTPQTPVRSVRLSAACAAPRAGADSTRKQRFGESGYPAG